MSAGCCAVKGLVPRALFIGVAIFYSIFRKNQARFCIKKRTYHLFRLLIFPGLCYDTPSYVFSAKEKAMKERLYYQDAYLREFDADVISCEPSGKGYQVVLSDTVFYPEGGGQPADCGVLLLPGGVEIQVEDVHEKDGVILHRTNRPVPVGCAVHGVIDWEVRFDHMQQHSGEHIVSGMICKKWNCDNVGFHMGADTVTIDYNAPISFEEILELEKEANRYLWEAHEIRVLYPTEEELKAIDYRSKKELTGEVRIVSFPGADTCACCGTHVKNSAEVGLIKFLSAVKFHDGTRFEMLSGKRAFDYLSACYREDKAVGVMLNAKATETAAIVQKMKEELGETKVALAKTEEEYFAIYADTFRGKGDVLLLREKMSSDSVRKLAVSVGEKAGGRTACFAGESEEYKYAVSDPSGDVRAFLQEMNAALSGKGGGKGGFAQGSCHASRQEILEFFRKKE